MIENIAAIVPVGQIDQPCVACGKLCLMPLIDVPGDPGPNRTMHRYVECPSCGTLAISEIPRDLGDYYRGDYYSFRPAIRPGIRRLFARLRNRQALEGNGIVAKAVDRFLPNYRLASLRPICGGELCAGDPRALSFADIGCGGGALLREMRELGYRKLTGIDPFMAEPAAEPGFRLIAGTIFEVDDRFDVVMFHHSLEHMTDPVSILRRTRELLAPKGIAVVRVPLAGGFAWRTYGGEWSQLDAPRHLWLFSENGQRRRFRRLAAELNAKRDGDQATFFLSPAQ